MADPAGRPRGRRRRVHHRLRRGAVARSGPPPTAALAIKGKHRTWILDDGRSDEVKALADELGCHYVRRLSSGGAKAGNINHALSIAKGDFFCVFDADFVPKPEFLVETVPFFTDTHVAFVQTPQTYGNLVNLVSRGAGYMQAVFYKFVQPGRNHFNAAFCVGTNVIYRRAAVNDIGGIYTDSKSEDVWTSLMLHERGWKTIYIPKTLAVGDAPETIEAYTKQQLRWATGGFEIMLTHNPLSPRRKLTMDQRLMYLVTATHYLTGIAPGILLIVPALEIFFDLRPVDLQIDWTTWLLFYAGFYLLQILLAFYTLGSFRWEVLMLAAVSFPIYISALLNALSGKEQKWHVTGSTTKAASPFNFIIPQVLTFVFLLLSSVGLHLARPRQQPAQPGHGLERDQHLHPGRLHDRRPQGELAQQAPAAEAEAGARAGQPPRRRGARPADHRHRPAGARRAASGFPSSDHRRQRPTTDTTDDHDTEPVPAGARPRCRAAESHEKEVAAK